MFIFPLDKLNNTICIIDYNQVLLWNKHVISTAAIDCILISLSHNCVKQREVNDSCIQIKRFVSTQCIPLFICYHRIIKVISVWQSELLSPPPNRRSCLGCSRKDMSNPKRLRWNRVLTETYESRSAITNDRKQTWRRLNNAQSELLGQFRLTSDRAK